MLVPLKFCLLENLHNEGGMSKERVTFWSSSFCFAASWDSPYIFFTCPEKWWNRTHQDQFKIYIVWLWSERKASAQSRHDYHYLLRHGSRAHNLSQAGLDLLSRSIRGKISLLTDTIVSLKAWLSHCFEGSERGTLIRASFNSWRAWKWSNSIRADHQCESGAAAAADIMRAE